MFVATVLKGKGVSEMLELMLADDSNVVRARQTSVNPPPTFHTCTRSY